MREISHKIFSRVITIKNDEMDTLKLHSHFENLLYVGRSVLTNTSSRIQRLFFKKEMCIYEYLFKEEASKGIEIVVDNAVLVCVLENDICNKSILYLNDSTNVTSYINYCNSTFEYDKLRDRWIMPDGYLTLFMPNDDFEKRFAFVQTLV